MWIFSFFVYALIFDFKFIFCDNIGDECNIEENAGKGRCVLLHNCPGALQALKDTGKRPKICGFEGTEPVICCLNSSSFEQNQNISKPPVVSHALIKSNQKCKAYAKYITEPFHLPLINEPETSGTPGCEIYTIPLIVGGLQDPKRYPHIALIGFDSTFNKTEWLCSGSLISEDFVLTAAHCLSTRELGIAKYVRLGDARVPSFSTNYDTVQDFTVKQSFSHPDYKPPSSYNDIGVLQLNRKVTLNKNIRPICLPSSQLPAIQSADFASWAIERILPSEEKIYLEQYMENYVSEEDCNKFYSNKTSIKRLKQGITYEKQLCAKKHLSKCLCLELSGGPLQIINKEVHCSYTIIGVYSFGTSYFVPDIPKVYSRVSFYMDWIESIVFGTE